MASRIRLSSGATRDVALDPPELESKLLEPNQWVRLERAGGGTIWVRAAAIELFRELEDAPKRVA